MSKVIFITGISSGFGKYTASFLAENGHIVYGTCRKPIDHDPRIKSIILDVTDKATVEESIRQVIEKEGRIDVLINNAGMHTGGAIEINPYDDVRKQIDTNLFGAIHTIRAVLPSMRKQKAGTIINISSIGGLMGLPFQGYYSASKFAIEGLSEALRMELKQFNIKVVVINPGDFHTHNTLNRKNVFVQENNNDYENQFKKSLTIIEKDENGGWDPEILARKMVKIVESKKPRQRYVIASFEQKLAVLLKYILPGSWFAKILEDHYGIKG